MFVIQGLTSYCFSRIVTFRFLSREEATDILAVGDWNRKLSFYQLSGKQVRLCFEEYSNTIFTYHLMRRISPPEMATKAVNSSSRRSNGLFHPFLEGTLSKGNVGHQKLPLD